MFKLTLSCACALALAVPPLLRSTAPAPAGPGAVEDAVRAFVGAQGDATKLEKLVGREWEQQRVIAWDRDGEQSFVAAGRVAVLERYAKPAPTQRITSIWAMCESQRCGYAYVELERTHGSGPQAKVERLRATALAEYVGGEGQTWRVFHWHVSPAPQASGQSSATSAPAPGPAPTKAK